MPDAWWMKTNKVWQLRSEVETKTDFWGSFLSQVILEFIFKSFSGLDIWMYKFLSRKWNPWILALWTTNFNYLFIFILESWNNCISKCLKPLKSFPVISQFYNNFVHTFCANWIFLSIYWSIMNWCLGLLLVVTKFYLHAHGCCVWACVRLRRDFFLWHLFLS